MPGNGENQGMGGLIEAGGKGFFSKDLLNY